MRETHVNLRNGEGIVFTDTVKIGPFIFVKFIFYKGASMGKHYHHFDKEFMITFSPSIRFNDSQKWKMFNFCKKGGQHSVANLSNTSYARVYAIKMRAK